MEDLAHWLPWLVIALINCVPSITAAILARRSLEVSEATHLVAVQTEVNSNSMREQLVNLTRREGVEEGVIKEKARADRAADENKIGP